MKKIEYQYPSNIICLTEESVEILYLLGAQDLIKGVSAFVKRPEKAMELPKVSHFTNSNFAKILQKNPDLVIGFSDIQKDIARELIGHGLEVYISNQRSLEEILSYTLKLSSMVGKSQEGEKLCQKLLAKINKVQELSSKFKVKPKVYFEEWDEPMISAIEWVSECIEICGGIDIFKNKSKGKLAKERFIEPSEVIFQNPDIIFGCWCGKRVKIDSIKQREGWQQISAVKNNRVYELAPEIFLQPGPAPIIDGLDILLKYFKEFQE